MKTLKFLFLLAALSALWQSGQAQCADIQQTFYHNSATYGFRAIPLSPDSSNATYTWNFGDGSSFSAQHVNHVYEFYNKYVVCLTYNGSLCSGTVCDTVYNNICDDTVPLNINYTFSGITGSFSADGVPAGSTYDWILNGADVRSTLANPQADFTYNGTFQISLVVTSPEGCIKMAYATIVVQNDCYSGWYLYKYGRDITIDQYDAYFHPTATYTWDFGDGTSSNLFEPTHSYAVPGTYNVRLATNNLSCNDTTYWLATITDPVCPSSDSLFTGYGANGDINFTSYAFDSFALNQTFHWGFGDGTTADSVFNLSHHYATAGDYIVCMTYTNNYCNVSKCDTITIDPCPATSVVQLIENDSTKSFTVLGGLTGWTYLWEFSGGTPNSLTADTVLVTYNTGGSYTGSVEIAAPGCGSPFTIPFNISVSDSGLCYLDFTTTPNSYNGVLFHTTGILGQAGTSYSYDYGDGSVGTIPAHYYASEGTFTVCFTRTSLACSSTVCKPVTINFSSGTYFGRIYKGSSSACNGIVYLIQEDSIGHLTAIDTFVFGTPDTCYAYFAFNAPPGAYYVKAALTSDDPDYADYLPTYYGNELNWANAATLIDIYTSHDINLIPGNNPGGAGFIGGFVSEGAGLGVINGNGEERSVGDPIANVQVNLLTENDVAVANTYTDGNGRYTFNNLALGSYKIYAEILNKTAASQIITLTANNPNQDNVEVLVNSHSAVTGINDITDIKLDGVFPNPVTDKAIIRFTAKQSANATVQVTDVLGNVMASTMANVYDGNNEVIVDLKNKASGIYYVSIINTTNKKIIKLIKAN